MGSQVGVVMIDPIKCALCAAPVTLARHSGSTWVYPCECIHRDTEKGLVELKMIDEFLVKIEEKYALHKP